MSYDIAVSVMCGFPLMAPTAVIYVKSFKMLVEICRSFLYRDMYFYGLGCRIYFSDGTVKIYDILGGKMSKIGRGVIGSIGRNCCILNVRLVFPESLEIIVPIPIENSVRRIVW